MVKIYQKNDDLSRVLSRSQIDNKALAESVKNIVEDVKTNKNKALFAYTKQFDGIDLNESLIEVSEAEIDDAYTRVDKNLLQALRSAKANILDYHKRQLKAFEPYFYNQNGNTLGWTYRPMDKVGLYIPGGKASYPSSILMCGLPAIAAGVEDVIVCTPNPKNPLTLVACREVGISKIFKVGGAQAISAMAYGTESIEKVDLIAGPGNVFVTMAKKEVYGSVAIDMIAGPSEILIICDETANAKFVASDMLSQAEHDENAASIVVTTSLAMAEEIKKNVILQTERLERKAIIAKSLQNNGAIIVVESLAEALDIANKIAPEHLEICAQNAEELAQKVKNAGAIFVGNYSPEPLGDYFAGPSHCLPTSGT
ncbi:MAG: histidinol dehydrogenase, partial [Clostridia bacterium]